MPLTSLQTAFIRRDSLECPGCAWVWDVDSVTTMLREALRAQLVEGCNCPGCGGWAKRYNRKLNGSIARWLIELVRRSPNGEWVEGSVVTKALGDLGKDATTLLPDWGLIEGCAVCQRQAGKWRPTELGREFVAGRAKVPMTIYTYNRERLGHDESKGDVSIHEVIGDRFDYDELMSAPAYDPDEPDPVPDDDEAYQSILESV
jgi:hypothetical protein